MNNDRIHKNKHELNKGISSLYNIRSDDNSKQLLFYYVRFSILEQEL